MSIFGGEKTYLPRICAFKATQRLSFEFSFGGKGLIANEVFSGLVSHGMDILAIE